MKRIITTILAALVVSIGLLATPAHAELDGPACTDDAVCDYWRSQANIATDRAELAEAQLLTHATEFASLRFTVETLQAEVADERRETSRAWAAEQRQRRVAERYFLRVLRMQERLTLLRVKLGLPGSLG